MDEQSTVGIQIPPSGRVILTIQSGVAGIWYSYAAGYPVSPCLTAQPNAEGSCRSSPTKRSEGGLSHEARSLLIGEERKYVPFAELASHLWDFWLNLS